MLFAWLLFFSCILFVFGQNFVRMNVSLRESILQSHYVLKIAWNCVRPLVTGSGNGWIEFVPQQVPLGVGPSSGGISWQVSADHFYVSVESQREIRLWGKYVVQKLVNATLTSPHSWHIPVPHWEWVIYNMRHDYACLHQGCLLRYLMKRTWFCL